MGIDIVIVNWNAGEQLGRCLASIVRFGSKLVKSVVVVDNASEDDSLNGIDQFGLPLRVVRNRENLGFARACNQGAACCDAPYILFLNPDTELFEKSLVVPQAFMECEANRNVGICGIQLIDEKGRVARSCAYFPLLTRFLSQAVGLNKISRFKGTGIHMEEKRHLTDGPVDHVIGAFFFTRRHVFEALKGFDERFFLYLEDTDFSLRAWQAGWKSVYLTDARAYHVGGGVSRQVKAARLFYSLRSRLFYGFKHFPRWQAWTLVAITLFAEPVFRLFFCAARAKWTELRDTFRAYRMLWWALPEIVTS